MANMAEELYGLSPEIRKLRKKLRQIENLEVLERDLTEDEHAKVLKKGDIRLTLQKLVSKREKLQKKVASEKSEEKQSFTEKQVTSIVKRNSSEADMELSSPASSLEHACLPQGSGEITSPNEEQPTTSTRPSANDVQPATSSANIQPTPAPDANVTKPPAILVTGMKQAGHSVSEKTRGQPSSQSKLQDMWKNSKFCVRTLKGHNDLICAVDCWQSTLVSGSRDTMLKLWDADTGQELRSMGGHTGTVTSVRLVPYKEREGGGALTSKRSLAVTGSKDCSIRVWSLDEGQMKSSIYAYSPVECVDYDQGLIASGSEGGKVELWNLETGENVRSIRAHDEQVTSIKFQKGRVVSGSSSGVVKIWDVRDGSFHSVMTSAEALKGSAGEAHVKSRHVRCLATRDDVVYWGDDGVNVKVLDLKLGKIRKLRNHVTEFGSTTAMATTPSLFISAGYDIDRGNGYMNVRSIPDEEYLATVDDECTGCVTCLACTESDKDGVTFCRWCTGGSDLKVWDQLPLGKVKKRTRSETEDSSFITTKHLRRYSSPEHSDTDSSDDETDAPNDHDSDDDEEFEVEGSSRSWCVIS